MQVLKSPPPNFQKILKVFNVEGQPICYTYGDTIYSPQGTDIPPHVLVHEQVHSKQQLGGSFTGFDTLKDPVESWWDLYLESPQFRLEQELEAYRAQYAHLKHTIHHRETLYKFLHKLASDLSGAMYNNLLTHQEAMRRIKQ